MVDRRSVGMALRSGAEEVNRQRFELSSRRAKHRGNFVDLKGNSRQNRATYENLLARDPSGALPKIARCVATMV